MVPMPEINGSALTMTDMMRYPRPTNIWDSHRVRRRVTHRIGTHPVRHSQPSTYPTSTFSLRDTHSLYCPIRALGSLQSIRHWQFPVSLCLLRRAASCEFIVMQAGLS